MMKNVNKMKDFYLGKTPTYEGYYFKDILSFDKRQFEHEHHFIQWLFPIDTISMHNLRAPRITKEEARELGDDQEVCRQVIWAFKFMLKMYDLHIFYPDGPGKIEVVPKDTFAGEWLSPSNHNYLRITRMLLCLTRMGLHTYAEALYQCLETLYRKYPKKIPEKTLKYWQDAVFNQ